MTETCPFHAQMEETVNKAADERTRIWEQTGKKLSFRVFSMVVAGLIAIGGMALGAQYVMISGFVKEAKAGITEIRKGQNELKESVTASVARIEYELKTLTTKHKADQEINALKRQLIESKVDKLDIK